jgi:hypothetical protein
MKKKKTPKSIQTILEKVLKGYRLSKLFSYQSFKFRPIVILTDEEITVNNSNFNLTIQCAAEKSTKKDLYKNLIKSPV